MDMDVELICSLKKYCDVCYFCDLHKSNYKSTLLNLNFNNNLPNGIINFIKIKNLLPSILKNYLSFSKSYLHHRKKNKGIYKLFHFVDLIRFIKKLNPDIIHINESIPIPFVLLLFSKYKKYYTLHDPFPHTGEANFKKALLKKLIINKSKRIILLNQKDLDPFIKKYRLQPNKVVLSSIGIYNVYKQLSNPKKNIIKNSILFFGRVSVYKGIDYLCQSIVSIQGEIPDLKTYIIGNGTYWFDINPYSSKGIKFINRYIPINELVEYINNVEIIVCPYTDATQSGVIMTALAFRKPIIATSVGGIPEILEHNVTGILVNPKNVKELSIAIKQLLYDKKKQEKLTENIENIFFKGNKSWDIISKNVYEHYMS